MLLGCFLIVYLFVALLTYSPVQSFFGAMASSYFSKEWNATVRLGALHVDPFNRVILHNLLLVDPEGDTVTQMEVLNCKFRHFPFRDGVVELDQVRLKNVYYYLRTDERGLNLDFIINYFASSDTVDDGLPAPPFMLKVKQVDLHNVHYKMKLKQSASYANLSHGVNISQMDFLDVDGRLKNVQVGIDAGHVDVLCRFVRFYALERSGFCLRDLSGDVHVSDKNISFQNMELTTPYTHMLSNINMDFDGWESMGDFCNNVVLTAVFQPGTVMSLQDAAYWAPMALWGMDEPVELDGVFYGPVGSMHAENVHIAFGTSSRLSLDAFIDGLPVIGKTIFSVKIRNLHTTYEDLSNIHHPAGIEMKVPDLMRKLSIFDINVDFEGGQQDCVAQVDMETALGNLALNAQVNFLEDQSNYSMKAQVSSRGFQLEPVWKNGWVTRSAFHLEADASGRDMQHLKADVVGCLTDTYVKGISIEDAHLSAHYTDNRLTAQLEVQDSLLQLQGNGDVLFSAGDTMLCDVDMNVDQFNLTQLHFLEGEQPVSLKMHLRGHVQYSDLESLNGSLSVSDLQYQCDEKSLQLTNVNVNVHSMENYKTISLNSDLAKLNVKGYFSYQELPLLARYLCGQYLPPTLVKGYGHDSVADFSPLKDNSIDVDLQWIDRRQLLNQLLPELHIAHGAHWNANYNYSQGLKMLLTADSIAYGPVTLHDMGLDGHISDSGYLLQLESATLSAGESVSFDQFRVDVHSNPDRILCGLHWNNEPADLETSGHLLMELVDYDSVGLIRLHQSNLVLQGNTWNLHCPTPIEIGPEHLRVEQFSASSGNQQLDLSAAIFNHADDKIILQMNDFQVGRLADIFLGGDIHLESKASGEVNALFIDDNVALSSNMEFEDCSLNGYFLDRISMVTTLNNEQKRLNISLDNHRFRNSSSIAPLKAQGYVDMAGNKAEIHAEVDLDSLALDVLTPFVSSFANEVGGDLSGHFALSGPFDSLQIDGRGMLRQGHLKVIPTGVAYHFSDSLYLVHNDLRLKDFNIHDEYNNTAVVNGVVDLSDFNNLQMDVRLRTRNLALIDKSSSGNNFYGRLFASVEGSVSGNMNNLSMNVSARTRPGSTITIPVDNRKEMAELDYITFVNPVRGGVSQVDKPELSERLSGNGNIHLTANLTITPDLQLMLPMSFSQMGVSIAAKGSGDLLLSSTSSSEPQLVGSYEISNGSLRLNLLGFFEKSFAIEPGSTLICPGDIGNAHFDISAVYSQRVSLSTLSTSLAEKAQQRILVDNLISVAGTIDKPEVKFDIRLPNADPSIADEVFALVDRANDREMLNQTISLLLSGSFFNSDNNNSLNTAASSGYNLVANSMGNVVSNMIKVVDVNFDYKAATETMTPQFDVDISKEWDKLYFETTIGYGGETRANSSSDITTNLVGDVTLGYKFTPNFQAFVFNRSNTNDFTRAELPYKQGAGIKFLRDFNNWKELFQKRNKKRHR